MQLVRFLLFSVMLLPLSLEAQKSRITILIDPGHGGSDPGNLSPNPDHKQEKEINLLIAQKFGYYLTQNLQNVDITYTRSGDDYVSLDTRVEQANTANVDYFISVHCNATEKTRCHGTESHVHTFDAKESVALAKCFEKEFSGRAGRTSRGVKNNNDREHSLQVLKYTKMTSVLVECGFLSNPAEDNYLNTEYGRDIIASAMFRAMRAHLQKQYPDISFLKDSKPAEASKIKSGRFYIQITSSREIIDTDHESFIRTGEKVIREKLNTTSAYKYRYLIGSYSSRSDAKAVLEKVRTKGFPDAIIIEK